MDFCIIVVIFLLISIILLYLYNPYEDSTHIIPIGKTVFIHNGKEWVKIQLGNCWGKELEKQNITNDKHTN